jgi:HTH-type transcriptional regulator / antitoxin HigA
MLTFEQLAETFPPGEAIKEELEERGWSQRDLAAIMGVQPSIVNGIVKGTKPISLDLARNLAAAFGTSAQYWVNMDTSYRLHLVPTPYVATSVRSQLYEVAPVNEMIKRGWIESAYDVEVLQSRIEAFYGRPIEQINSGDLCYAARQGTEYGDGPTPAQRAWLRRARILAKAVHAELFTSSSIDAAIEKLRPLMGHAEEARHVPRVLAECGIRFLVIEQLAQTRIDGVCLWLDEQRPVIAVSMRYDRLDYFWFTVLHELGHVNKRDGLTTVLAPDVDLVGEKASKTDLKPEVEQMADLFATEHMIQQSEIENFIMRVKPMFSKVKIQGFALRQGIHPAIVIGQLQHRGAIHWSHSREFLVKVRDIITSTALTDGWGQILPNIT